ELGYFFNDLPFAGRTPFPLLYFGVFDKALVFCHKSGMFNVPQAEKLFSKCPSLQDASSTRNMNFSISKESYSKTVNSIKEEIKKGSTYQVNFTGKIRFDFSGSPYLFYQSLKNSQRTSYSAFFKIKNRFVLSLSPELFLKRDRENILSRPMKGTIRRGKTVREDKDIQDSFAKDEKEKAENLMIVDLIRNDLGKISRTGSVRVKDLFHIEKYDSLFQMTSTVCARLKPNVTYLDIFRSLFPSGSVTGAPKIKTMEIIRSLEKESRDIYCGAMGIIFPGKKAVFSIPIRTVSLENSKGFMGVGSGVVWDSSAEKEYQECFLKKSFMEKRQRDFDLIETMLWQEAYWLLNKHLERLKDSASYFQFPFDKKKVLAELKKVSKHLQKNEKYKVRLLLGKSGVLSLSATPLKDNTQKPCKMAVSSFQTDPDDMFFYHKTTKRDLYSSEHKKYQSKGYFDVVFFNKHGKLTEGAISNIFLIKNKKWYTPSLTCGLLNGVCRQHVMKKIKVTEKELTRDDLLNCDEIVLTNSVRGIVRNVKLDTGCMMHDTGYKEDRN
ncbi:MAG: aminodeoxychorismate synthase component I, partial [Candidatus Aureabacteria bacterium]|nr:aminodeoxychorismate synthase component I [Candidatus Auribacterota bacterium]